MIKTLTPSSLHKKPGQSGNIFFMLFAAVAVVGAIGVGTSNHLKGIVTSMSDVTRKTVAEEKMVGGARLSVQAATSVQSNAGDCDSDGMVEPLPFRDAGAGPKPAGGGYIPQSIGAETKDPWGVEYGYCVWDAGSQFDAAGCGGPGANRLAGSPNAAHTVVAIISAGKNRKFETSCNAYVDTTPADGSPDTPLIGRATGGDDIIMEYTYNDASGLSGEDLWKIRDTSPDIATIDKNIEVSGSGEFSGAINLMSSGLVLPDNTMTGACNSTTDQQLRINGSTSPPSLEICHGNAWEPIAMAGGASGGDVTDGLVAKWDMDDAPDEIIADSIGNKDGTWTGSPPFLSTTGYLGSAVGFSGVDGEAFNMPNDLNGLGTFTVSTWVQGNAGTNNTEYQTILSDRNNSPGGGLGTFFMWWSSQDANGGAACQLDPDWDNDDAAMVESAPLAGGEWHFLTCSYDGADLRLYVNGSLVNTDSAQGTRTKTDFDLTIGDVTANITSPNFAFSGLIDETRVYNRALTGSEIQTLYEYYEDLSAAQNAPQNDFPQFLTDDHFLGCSSGGRGPFVLESTISTATLAHSNQNLLFLVQSGGMLSADYDGTGLGLAAVAAPPAALWSDDRRAYYASTGGNIYAYNYDSSGNFGAGQVATTSYGISHLSGDSSYIYVSAGASGVVAYSDDGAAFTQRGIENTPGTAQHAWSDGEFIYVSDMAGGLRIYRFDGSSFSLVTSVAPGGNVRQSWGDGNYLYVGTTTGLYAYAFDGETLTLKGALNGGSIAALWGTGNVIFAGYASGTIKALSFTGTQFNGLAEYNAGLTPVSFSGNGHYLYASFSSGGTQLLKGFGCNQSAAPSPGILVAADKHRGKISAGGDFSCGIKSDSTAWCWGSDTDGRLGNGAAVTAAQTSPAPLDSSLDANSFSQISNGIGGGATGFACGIKTDGTLWCWGSDASGQLGNGAVMTANQPAPYKVDNNVWGLVSAGAQHACAIRNDGTLWCWGNGANGRLGNGGTSSQSLPVQIGTDRWAQVSSGLQTTCGIKTDGSAWCWGAHTYGNLGIGPASSNQTTPAPVAEPGIWVHIAKPFYHTCGLKADGSAWCWGWANNGTLGDTLDALREINVPVRISDNGPWMDVSVNNVHSCGIKLDGTAWCWGQDQYGRLGNGSASSTTMYAPSPVADPGPWSSLSAGPEHTCGLKTDGSAWCWGRDNDGELGNTSSTTGDQAFPSRVYNFPNAEPWTWDAAQTVLNRTNTSAPAVMSSTASIGYDDLSGGFTLRDTNANSVMRHSSGNVEWKVETTGSGASTQISLDAGSVANARSIGVDHATGNLEFGVNTGTASNWMNAITPQIIVTPAGQVSVGGSTAGAALETSTTGLKVGNDTRDCTPSRQGTLRYTGASPAFEFCNGAAWVGF